MLRALYATVEVTMRRAAREQREGRSMAFDAMRAMEAPAPAGPFPRAEGPSRPIQAGISLSKCRPRVGEDEETESHISEVCVSGQCLFSS